MFRRSFAAHTPIRLPLTQLRKPKWTRSVDMHWRFLCVGAKWRFKPRFIETKIHERRLKPRYSLRGQEANGGLLMNEWIPWLDP
jgi:hypothetical protein